MKDIFSKGQEKIIKEFPEKGVFLTGIENSDPFVSGVRRDQLKEAFDFYANYETRLENIKRLGISWLRFGPAYSKMHLGVNDYDFQFTDKIIDKCRSLGITIIADLMHFGLPDWLHLENPDHPFYQNSMFPDTFVQYVESFVKRYPHIRYFTPINEPYVTAYFSAKIGVWNESIKGEWHDDKAFINAVKNISKAFILSKNKIEQIWKIENRQNIPIFIQNESFELALLGHHLRKEEVQRFNLRKFAVLDLIMGIDDKKMHEYLLSQGMDNPAYYWFMRHGNRENMVLGMDHYSTCVHIFEEGIVIDCTPLHPSQLYHLIVEYAERYKIPLLHTETNAWPDNAVKVCQDTYDTISKLRTEGYPIMGMGWYGDEYQVGWHHILVGSRSYEESLVGLFYKGELQPVGQLFNSLVTDGLPKIR